jgi:LemA protein
MRKEKIRSLFSYGMLATLLGGQLAFAAWQLKPLTRDDTYRTIARRVNAQTESPITDVIGALDEVIEVGELTVSEKDGKTTAIVKERTPSSAAHTNKVIRLVFAAAGNNWAWESFENDRKLYPVERLFPYAKDELTRRKQAATTKWAALLDLMTKHGEAAAKTLETAKAIIKKDPDPLGPVTAARAALAKARESGEADAIKSAYKELAQTIEPIPALADSFQDLKANDAYLRLAEELNGVQTRIAATRKEYLDAVAAYNEILRRLPFALVAYGLGFQKIEPQIEAE